MCAHFHVIEKRNRYNADAARGQTQDASLRLGTGVEVAAELDYRLVLDTFADAVIASDGTDHIVYANAACQKLLGWSGPDLVGMPLTTIMPQRMRAAHAAGFRRYIETGRGKIIGAPIRVPALHRDGTEIDIELTLSALRIEDAEHLIVASLRDLRQRVELERQILTQKHLRAQNSVLLALMHSKSLQEGAPKLLQGIGQALDWDAGVFWLVDEQSTTLRALSAWVASEADEAFARASMERVFQPGEGLPGSTWASAKPMWSADVAEDERYGRRAIAAGEGLHGAFLFPVRSGDRVRAVIEFVSRIPREPDQDLLLTTENLGIQIGQFLARIKAEAELRATEQRSILLAEVIPQFVWVTNAAGELEYVNRRWTEYTGLGVEESRRGEWRKAIHPEDLERVRDGWREAVSTGTAYDLQARYRRASDGTYRWYLVQAAPLRDESGSILQWVGTSTDIEDQKRSEDAVRFWADASTVLGASLDYEETLKSVANLAVPHIADWCAIYLESGPGPARQLVVTHADPSKVEWAKQLEQKYPPHPSTPRAADNVIRTGKPEFYPDVPDEFLARTARDAEHLRALQGVGVKSVITVPLKARGRAFGAITLATAESGRRYSAADLAVAQELADRSGHAVDNARLYNEAQEAIRVRDDFLSIASHELKTPLTPLQLHVQSILRGAWGGSPEQISPKLAGKLETIDRQVSRMEKLINGLLDISRITNKSLDLDCEELDLSALVKDVGSQFNEQLARAGCLLVTDAPSPVVGCWDKLRLDQILSNLLANALKFGPGKPIEVRVEMLNGDARLIVRDHGIGIAPEDQARIFERFERAVPTKHYGGFGLGLWITRQIVERLGGSVRVQSSPGAGSTFTVTLPTAAPADDERPPTSAVH